MGPYYNDITRFNIVYLPPAAPFLCLSGNKEKGERKCLCPSLAPSLGNGHLGSEGKPIGTGFPLPTCAKRQRTASPSKEALARSKSDARFFLIKNGQPLFSLPGGFPHPYPKFRPAAGRSGLFPSTREREWG